MPQAIYLRSGAVRRTGTDKGISMARRGLLAIAFVAVLLVASMAAAFVLLNNDDDGPVGEKPTAQSITVMDDRGKNVTLAKAPERIVSLGSSFTEIIVNLEHKDNIVAVDESGLVYFDNADNVANLGQVSKLGVESILAQDPDCVVIWNFNMYKPFIGNMENASITVLAFYPKGVDDVLSTITRLGAAIGEGANATLMVNDMQERIDAISDITSALDDSEKPRVYLELKSGGGSTVRSGSISDELIALAGGFNVFHDLPTSEKLQVASEAIVAKNPDIIVIENGSTKTNNQLKSTLGPSVSAVADNKIYRIDDGTLTTGPGMVDALEDLAKWLHPELFD